MNDFERGAECAWELARTIIGYDGDCFTVGELDDIFGDSDFEWIFKKTHLKKLNRKSKNGRNRRRKKKCSK